MTTPPPPPITDAELMALDTMVEMHQSVTRGNGEAVCLWCDTLWPCSFHRLVPRLLAAHRVLLNAARAVVEHKGLDQGGAAAFRAKWDALEAAVAGTAGRRVEQRTQP